jgi:hypothetical protein
VIHPEWWSLSLEDAQQRVYDGGSTFGEAVDALIADFLTSQEFLSFLLTQSAGRMTAGAALDEAIYAVTEELATRLQALRAPTSAHRVRHQLGAAAALG